MFFWLYHLPGFLTDSGSWAITAALMGFLLIPHLASRLVVGWLYNAAGASVLIGGLFHAMHNAMVNPTGLGVAVLGLPQLDLLAILSGLVVLAGGLVVGLTRGASDCGGPLSRPASRSRASMVSQAIRDRRTRHRRPLHRRDHHPLRRSECFLGVRCGSVEPHLPGPDVVPFRDGTRHPPHGT